MDPGQDHGHLQDLSSPILSKIQEGFLYMRSCLVDDASDMFTRFGSLQGALATNTRYVVASAAIMLSLRHFQ